MGNLSNLYISQSFISLIHLGSNNTASVTPTELEDGLGNGIGIYVNTSGSVSASSYSGSVNGIGNVTLYSASVNSRIVNLELFSSSLDATFATDAQLNASSSTLQANINTKLDTASFNTFSSSNYEIEVSQSQQISASFASASAYSASLQTSILAVSNSVSTSNGNTTALSASIYQTDTTQSFQIGANAATASGFSASLSTTITNNSASTFQTDATQSFQITANALTASNSLTSLSQSLYFTDTTQSANINSLTALTSSYARINQNNTFAAGTTQSFDYLVANSASITYLKVIFQTSSVVYSSGSNILGDNANDDVQTLIGRNILTGSAEVTGSLRVSSDISSSTISGIGNVTLYSASVAASITASTANVTLLSQSLYFTDTTQSVNITQASASAWGAFQSASAYSASAYQVDATQSFQITANALTASNALTNYSSSQSTLNNTLSSSIATNSSSIGLLQTFSGSQYKNDSSSFDSRIDSLETAGYVTSAITASSIITASVSQSTITFTKGNGSTFNIVVADISGSTLDTGSLVTTASFNAYTQSTNTFTASISTSVGLLQTFSGSQYKNDSSSFDTRIIAAENTGYVTTASFNAFTQSTNDFTSSITSSYNATSSSLNSVSSSLLEVSGAFVITSASLNSVSSSLLEVSGAFVITSASLNSVSSSVGLLQTFSSSQYKADSSSFDSRILAAGGTQVLLDEGTILGNATAFNFIGSGVTATLSAGTASVTIPGGGGSIYTGSFAITGSNTFSGSQIINGNVNITGSLTASGIKYPIADGLAGQFIVTDGVGTLAFDDVHVLLEDVRYGEDITLGDPLYVNGSNGNIPIVFKADASNPAKMPVIYIAKSTGVTNTNTTALTLGLITGVTTTGYAAGTTIYVAEGGGWTSSRPSGSTSIVQPLGIVTKEGAGGSGRGLILNVGPAFLPNIQTGYVWVGNGTNQPTAVATSSFVNINQTGSFATTASFNAYTQSTNTFTASISTSVGLLQQFSGSEYKADSSSFNTRILAIPTINTSSFATTGSNSLTGSQIITGSLTITGSVATPPVALSIASNTASIDFSKGSIYTLTLVSSSVATYITASNLTPGQTANLVVTQASVLSGSIVWASSFKFPTGSAYTGSKVVNAVDLISFITVNNSTIYSVGASNLV